MTAEVTIDRITHRFGGFVALNDVNLTIGAGEFAVLLGPSGCGKTTLLSMIGGFLNPSEGRILIGGNDVTHLPPSARPTTTMFQDYALFPHMTVAQNVAFGLRMQKLVKDTITMQVAEIAELLGLSGQLAKYPHQMSGGQQQRAAVARALVTRPKVLLLDEPLGALDLKMRKHMQNELKKLQREVGITFVYVTHDQEEALNLSDTVVVMDHGRIVQQGSPVEVYQRPTSGYVADFIGEANLLSGYLREMRATEAIVDTNFGSVEGCLAQGFSPAKGGEVLVSIRPQHVRLGGVGEGGHLTVSGTLADSAYLGSVTRLSVQVGDRVIRADITGVPEVQVGEEVVLGWRAEHARVLAADARFTGGRDSLEIKP